MKYLIFRWLIRLRYLVEVEWVMPFDKNDATSIVVWSLCSSQLDPFFLLVYGPTHRAPCIAVPQNKIVLKWIRSVLTKLGSIFLPLFSDRAARFFGRRLLRQVSLELKKHSHQDWIIFFEGAKNPLPQALCEPKKRRIILATIEGMEGSRFAVGAPLQQVGFLNLFWLLLQNGFFWMPKRKVKLTFRDVTEEFFKPLSTEDFQKKWIGFFQQKKPPAQNVPDVFWKKASHLQTSKHQERILKEVARLAKKPVSSIQPRMHLYDDLMLDSLDVTELIVILEKEFHQHATFSALEKVQDVLDAAVGRPRFKTYEQILQEKVLPNWVKPRPSIEPPQGKTLGEAFLRSCDRMGQNLASTDLIEALSYTRLKTLAVGFAKTLQKLPGTEIGLLIPPTSEMYAVIFSLILAGKIPVVLNWSQGPHWVDQILKQTSIQVILTTASFLQQLPLELSDEAENKMVLLEELRSSITLSEREAGLRLSRLPAEQLMRHFKLDKLSGDETAVILFTSGTEKGPKGVMLSHRNLLSNHLSILEFIAFKSDDVLLGMLPLFHIYGFSLTGIFPLLIGLKVVYHPSPLDFQRILKQIQGWKVTILATVPTFLRGLFQIATAHLLKTLRLCVIGAEKPPADLVKNIRSILPHIQIIEGYGLTECSPVLTLKKAAEEKGVGKFLQGIEYLIVDPETLQPNPPEKTGLILVRGPSIFRGYFKSSINPFLEINGQLWFNTQDLGFLDHHQVLHLQGRQSRTVKIGGEMISLPSLEEILLKTFLQKYPALQLAILGEVDAKKGAHLVLVTNQPLSLEEVNHALSQAGTSPLLRIAAIKKLDALPLTPIGKIDYKQLEAFLKH